MAAPVDVDLTNLLAARLRAAGVENADDEALRVSSLTSVDASELDAWIERRLRGEPWELIVGRVRFMDIDLSVAPGVLVPRPETELLARAGLERLGRMGLAAPRVVDICCGSGNVGLAIAHHVRCARVWLADLTESCVALARANAERLGLDERVTVHQGDLFGGFEGLSLEASIDLIVCNPPYISSGKLAADRADLLRFEPREAFDAGPYGLDIHKRALAEGARYLKPGGWLACEFGLGQSRQVEFLFRRTEAFGPVEFVTNEIGEPRVACAQRRAPG